MRKFFSVNADLAVPVVPIVVWLAASAALRRSGYLLRKMRQFLIITPGRQRTPLGRAPAFSHAEGIRGAFCLIALLLAFSSSCSHDTVFTLSSAYGDKVLIAEDRTTMESTIDCAIAKDCGQLSVRHLLAEGKVFLVDTGTRVAMEDGFTLSSARRIRVLEGRHAGKTGWIYDRTVRLGRSNRSPRLASAAGTYNQ
jgi:hypothetical protein